MKDLLVGVDVGGTKIAALVVDGAEQVRARATRPMPPGSPETALEAIARTVEVAVGEAGAERGTVAAVGLGVPGRVDVGTGLVRLAVNLGWEEVAAGPWLAHRLGLPCFLENDVRAAAVGLQHHPTFAHVHNLLYLSVGTGISAGLILGGQLYRGAHGMAGEIGHMIVVPGGPRCACGSAGCLEALAAGPAIARQGAEARDSGAAPVLQGRPVVTAEIVYEAARAGDPGAIAIVDRAGALLAQAIEGLVMAYDVERIVVGGGVTHAGDTFLQPVARALTRLAAESPLVHTMLPVQLLETLPPDYAAGPWGALILARRHLVTDQRVAADGMEGGELPHATTPRWGGLSG